MAHQCTHEGRTVHIDADICPDCARGLIAVIEHGTWQLHHDKEVAASLEANNLVDGRVKMRETRRRELHEELADTSDEEE